MITGEHVTGVLYCIINNSNSKVSPLNACKSNLYRRRVHLAAQEREVYDGRIIRDNDKWHVQKLLYFSEIRCQKYVFKWLVPVRLSPRQMPSREFSRWPL